MGRLGYGPGSDSTWAGQGCRGVRGYGLCRGGAGVGASQWLGQIWPVARQKPYKSSWVLRVEGARNMGEAFSVFKSVVAN